MFASKSMKRFQSQQTILSAFEESKRSSIVGCQNTQIKRVLYPGHFQSIDRKIRQCFIKLKLYSKRKVQADARIVYAVYRIFRSNEQKMKFEAIQRMKKITIANKKQQLQIAKQTFHAAQSNAFRFIALFFKNKMKNNIKKSFETLKAQSSLQKASRKLKLIKLAKFIIRGRTQTLKQSFIKIKQSKLAEKKRIRVKQIATIIKNHREYIFKSAMVRLKKNMIALKGQQIKTDVNELEIKIETHNAAQLQTLTERRKKLEKSLQEINDDRKKIEEELNEQLKQPLLKLRETQNIRNNMLAHNNKIQENINLLTAHINQNFAFEEICQFMINNMLLYLHRNLNLPIKRQELLKSMQIPLLPLNIDTTYIKQQNKVMQQLINEYIVIFGPKALQMKERQIQLPYQYVIKENFLLHKALLTLLNRVNMTKDDIGAIRQFAYDAQEAVKQLERCGQR